MHSIKYKIIVETSYMTNLWNNTSPFIKNKENTFRQLDIKAIKT